MGRKDAYIKETSETRKKQAPSKYCGRSTGFCNGLGSKKRWKVRTGSPSKRNWSSVLRE